MPVQDCPDIGEEMTMARLPGMVAEINHSYCCPKVDVVCKIETCPPPIICDEEFYEPVRRDTENCCPQYKCGQ